MSGAAPVAMKFAHVKKDGSIISPLRAAGLCLELALKTGFLKGFHSVTEEELQTVTLHGQDFLVKTQTGSWQRSEKVVLDMTADVVAFVLSAYKTLLSILHKLGFNVVAVDKRIPGGVGSHDLLASYITPQSLVDGLLSIEVKIRRCGHNFARVLQMIKADMETRYQALQKLQSQKPIQGLALILCKAAKNWANKWIVSGFVVELFTGKTWVKLHASSVPRQVLKPVAAVLSEIIWHKHPKKKGQVGLLSSFVKAIGKSTAHVGVRAALWNKLLAQEGAKERVQKLKLNLKPGQPPWVGSASAFKKIHKIIRAASQ